jgi:hypothetical protein
VQAILQVLCHESVSEADSELARRGFWTGKQGLVGLSSCLAELGWLKFHAFLVKPFSSVLL